MVLLLDGNSKHVQSWGKIGLYGKKIQFETALDLIEHPKQIKKQRLNLTGTLISELPSNI